jgi:hypothetical protein
MSAAATTGLLEHWIENRKPIIDAIEHATDHEFIQTQLEWLVKRFGVFTEKLEPEVVFVWWDQV